MATFMNLDAGELDTETEALWSMFDVLCCACGGHAGDEASMARVAAFCARTAAGGSRGDAAGGSRGDAADGSRGDAAGGSRGDAADGSRGDAAGGSRGDAADGSRGDAAGGSRGDATGGSRGGGAAGGSRHAVALGAHPSYPDRAGFGRRSMARELAGDARGLDDLARSIEAQCLALARAAAGAVIRHVKPHGALYHDAAREPAIAEAVVRGAIAALGSDLIIIGPPVGVLRDAALAHGLRHAREGFADRGMRADGSLVPRGEAGALITDPSAAARQAVRLAPGVDTICVHADTPDAIAIARAVREALA